MRLYWHPFSIFPRRVRIAIREKGIRCEEVEVDLPGGATRAAEFRRLNPFGQVPVLEDEGVVTESVAILGYLEERHPVRHCIEHCRRPRRRASSCGGRRLLGGAVEALADAGLAPESTWDRADQERAAAGWARISTSSADACRARVSARRRRRSPTSPRTAGLADPAASPAASARSSLSGHPAAYKCLVERRLRRRPIQARTRPVYPMDSWRVSERQHRECGQR
jgi:glutathione S-transferase